MAKYESAGKLPVFTHHGHDLEQPGVLAEVVKQVSYNKEIILVCGDAKPTASAANGLNTLMQFRALRLHHILYLSDSTESCASVRLALPEVACVWSSRISPTKPKHGGLCVQLYWGYAFYFYDLRKHYTTRITSELGINVLHTDTDVVWLANPYPALKTVFRDQQIVGMSDRPMINAGVFYVQNVAKHDGASWVLREMSRRIHAFILRPSAVKDYVPWAQAPFYANVDEQTLMNDCVRSAVANVTSFAQATAGWEVKRHRTGTVANRSFYFKRTPEHRLNTWLSRVVSAAGRRTRLDPSVSLRELCGYPMIKSVGTVFPLHHVGSSAAPSSTLTIGPSWLFMHLPSSMAASSIRRCRQLANTSSVGDDAAVDGRAGDHSQVGQDHTGTRSHMSGEGHSSSGNDSGSGSGGSTPAAPFIMAHLAGVRTGAWSRRALIRAYGWWDTRADALIARQLGWRKAYVGTVHLVGADRVATRANQLASLAGIRTQAHLDIVIGNLLVVGMLTKRRAVVPEVRCGIEPSKSPHRGYGHRPVGARAARATEASCAWMPPKECWTVPYITQLEYESEAERIPLAPLQATHEKAVGDSATFQDGHCWGSGSRLELGSNAALVFSKNLTSAVHKRLNAGLCDTSSALALLPADANELQESLEALAHRPLLHHSIDQLLTYAPYAPYSKATAECVRSLYRYGLEL